MKKHPIRPKQIYFLPSKHIETHSMSEGESNASESANAEVENGSDFNPKVSQKNDLV